MLCLLVFVCAGGCSYNQVLIKDSTILDEKDGLKAAFKEYWRLMGRKEVEKAFAREAPHVQEMVSVEKYRLYQNLLMKAGLQEVKVQDVVCEKPFLCCVNCQMTYGSSSNSKGEKRELRDCWVRVRGSWYHVFRSPLFFPM